VRRAMLTRLPMTTLALSMLLSFLACKDDGSETGVQPPEEGEFHFGADLSYVNQILDHGGSYRDEGEVRDPYRIFSDHGATLVRVRLWHSPDWTRTVYDPPSVQRYHDLSDVERTIANAKQYGMQVLLDFHYSDVWADPGHQEIPAAWKDITDIATLKDSVYQYTFKVLSALESKGLLPEFVQTGNEINCGMLFTDSPPQFPACDACNGAWDNLAEVINSAIAAVRDVSAASSAETRVILHVADPKNVEWWFDNITSHGVTDFDIIGFSYYPLWHTTVPLDQLGDQVRTFSQRYDKPVMVLETAYPWTTSGADGYNNIFGGQTPIEGYPFTQEGQLNMMKAITQEVKNGGGAGVIYWEPAWITSNMRDLWGTGSAWENCTFFDFDGNAISSIDYMKADYE
jgi:arabinogalactan endo-1,4-beta-galactosidase